MKKTLGVNHFLFLLGCSLLSFVRKIGKNKSSRQTPPDTGVTVFCDKIVTTINLQILCERCCLKLLLQKWYYNQFRKKIRKHC